MEDTAAIAMFAALAQEHRLTIFRALVRAGPSGMPSTQIAVAAGVSPTSASFHLKELERAGLLIASRHGRFIRYAVHVEAMRALINYLTEDCCQGRPELCGSALGRARAVCTPDGDPK
jgi:DNA-binding transcriptional ArsR family regulator